MVHHHYRVPVSGAACKPVVFPSPYRPIRCKTPCAANPYADPKADPCDPLEYIASNALTGVAFSRSCSHFTILFRDDYVILGLIIATALVQTMVWREVHVL